MKNTKMPAIRFKGFNDDWEQRKLGQVAEFNPKSEIPEVFEYVDLESVVGTEMVSHRTEIKDSAPSRAQRLAQVGDVFYQTVRPYQKNNYLFEKPDNNYVFSTGYAQLRPFIDARFLMSYLQTENFVKVVMDNCTGTSYPAINSSDLANIKISLPNNSTEQQQIGTYFSNLDNFITLHQRKLEKIKLMKKSMLGKMFPKDAESIPKIRFNRYTDDWEQRKLGEYVSITSGEAPSKFEEGTELYVKVDDLNYNDKYVVDTQNKVAEHSTVKRVTKGSVVFPKRGAAIMTNKVRIMGIDSYMDTNMMALTSEKLDSEFLYNIISKEGLYKIADTSTIPQINNKHVEPYEVTIPSLAEQRRIGAYFKQLDHLITLHQRKLEKLKKAKKSLLEHMFPMEK